jgi:hypothetical protein
MSNEPISERFRLTAKEYTNANAAADLLEEMKSATLSQRMVALGDIPVSRAEMLVKASTEWAEYIEAMVEARKRANMLKAEVDWLKMRFSEQQSEEATRRMEARL